MNNQKLETAVNNIMPFVKPIYECLREEGLSMEDCLQVYETTIKLCMVDELTKRAKK